MYFVLACCLFKLQSVFLDGFLYKLFMCSIVIVLCMHVSVCMSVVVVLITFVQFVCLFLYRSDNLDVNFRSRHYIDLMT